MTTCLTRLTAPGGCCGGLSTLRGTPPQHLFGVDLLWNDRRDSHYCFKHRSILKSCLESLWVALEGSRAPFWELWGSILGAKIVNFGSLGGPWHPEKTRPEKETKKGGSGYGHSPILETILASFFVDFSAYFLVRFFDDFWSHFGAILGAHLASFFDHFSIEKCIEFLIDFGKGFGCQNVRIFINLGSRFLCFF